MVQIMSMLTGLRRAREEKMDHSFDEIIKYIEEEDVKFIRLAFRDAFGVQKNLSVMPGEIMKAFNEGIPVKAAEFAGFEDSPHSSLYLKPDPSTITVLPWRPDNGRVFRMFCDLYTPEGDHFEADTRRILKNAVRTASEHGILFKFGSEAEFYLFRKDDDGNPTKVPYDRAGYMDIAPLDKCENIRREICLTIERMGLTPERSYHERGAGQNQIDFHYGAPLKAADQITTFKMVVDTVADRNGLIADFSPLPLKGSPGNGYHINIYARDKDGNDVVKYAAAGIINKIRDITLFLNPTEESYSRFGSSTAPSRANWSSSGRSELMCIETYKDNTRVSLRSPDASCNPYLVYALLIYAGLWGIDNKLSLPDEMESNSALLPGNIKEAVELAENSEFVSSIVPEAILNGYTKVKR